MHNRPHPTLRGAAALAALCSCLLDAGASQVLAQAKRPAKPAAKAPPKSAAKPVASQPAKKPAVLRGAWAGTMTYTRTQSMGDSTTKDRASGRGKESREWRMDYDYKARVVVVGSPEQDGSSVGRATIAHTMSSVEKVTSTEKNSCDNGKTFRDMKAETVSKTQAKGQASAQEASVTIGVNDDGTYSLGLGLPQIQGTVTGSNSATFSGQCTPVKPTNDTLPTTPTTIDGNSLSTEGADRVREGDPNHLSGSFSKTWQGVTETLTWDLQKGDAPLRLMALEFEEMKFPDWNSWQEVSEQAGTTDGNIVRVRAVVANPSGEEKSATIKLKETFKGDKWNSALPDGLLEGGELPVSVGPGEQAEVELSWDSSGYAWFDDGRPRLVQRIRAEMEEAGKKTGELTRNLKVAPKPVILVHGLWSNWGAWAPWQNILTSAHSYDWKAFPVGEKPEHGIMNTGGEFLSTQPTATVAENSQQLGKYIAYAQELRNAWHVDVVAHSMGGIISRHYIDQSMPAAAPDGRPQIAHLVMLGTPHLGSPAADIMDMDFRMLGKQVEAVRQLRQDSMALFNQAHTNRKGVKFSALAGNPLPAMSKAIVWNDGVVPVPSATWTIRDTALSPRLHTNLTSTEDFTAFVKPRLAIGPKGNHAPELALRPVPEGLSARSVAASPADDVPNALGGSKHRSTSETLLGPKQSREFALPTGPASTCDVFAMADARISATVHDGTGAVVAQSLAGTPEASAWLRLVASGKPISKWTLKLENTSDFTLPAIFSLWEDASQ